MKTKVAISTTCLLLAVAHVALPAITFDVPTMVLLVLAILPWLAAVIRSVELPGGFKIELQDVKAATDKLPPPAVPSTPSRVTEAADLDFLRRDDPNLAMVAIRIEIERRLNRLANRAGLSMVNRSAGAVLRALEKHDRIDDGTATALSELITLGNQAAHGVMVSASAALWALDKAPLILGALDRLLEEPPPGGADQG